jgi:hypothetical protein
LGFRHCCWGFEPLAAGICGDRTAVSASSTLFSGSGKSSNVSKGVSAAESVSRLLPGSADIADAGQVFRAVQAPVTGAVPAAVAAGQVADMGSCRCALREGGGVHHYHHYHRHRPLAGIHLVVPPG